jgi:hypothetical protein
MRIYSNRYYQPTTIFHDDMTMLIVTGHVCGSLDDLDPCDAAALAIADGEPHIDNHDKSFRLSLVEIDVTDLVVDGTSSSPLSLFSSLLPMSLSSFASLLLLLLLVLLTG